MSEQDPAPNADVFEQLRAAGDAAMPALLKRLNDVVQSGGKVTRSYLCTACKTKNTVDHEVIDVEEHRKLVEMFANIRIRAHQVQKGEDSSAAATKLLRHREDLSDRDLAEYIAALESELAA